jgi:DNA-binding transcriptional LysR family regulator
MYEWAEFRHFKYLLAILELQGFRAAAEELHTAQPNLSIQAKQFQENASVRLYEKGKDGRIRPTNTGVAFQVLAKSLLEARDEAFEALSAIDRGEIATVRLGCSPLADPGLFRDFCEMHRELLPACTIWPERADTTQLVDDVLAGVVDAAIVTLPLDNAELGVAGLRQDRLVVCLRQDDPLAIKSALKPADLKDKITIIYHPQRHPAAHDRLLELLGEVGIEIPEFSRASHPSEMQALVKDGFGLALIREGTVLDSGLTTRPIAGVDWTVDTVVIYRQQHHPKTIPVVVRNLRRRLRKEKKQLSVPSPKFPPKSVKDKPVQLSLLG